MPDDRARNVRVVCFDVDGTLVEHAEDKTIWQILNVTFHDGAELNKLRFGAFQSGLISYDEWVALDILDWKSRGVRRQSIADLIESSLVPAEGARETIDGLRRRGLRVVVISGTLGITLDLLLPGLRFDKVFTNEIEFDDEGRISGWRATPFDVHGKAAAIELVASEFDVSPEQCAFVGDGWNDLHAFERAGYGIAYKPKIEEVRSAADVVIESGSLTRVLELIPGDGR